MTNAQYEVLQGSIDGMYDSFYDRAEYIEECGSVSDFLKLKDWVNEKHDNIKSWAINYNADVEVLKEIDYDFNYLLNEIDNAIKEN